ncbi:Uu.00g124120.m01.CDS01 [Anthostomella pinea]|uniref:Uu.00g124120.m01.CDS01 n=1 Tax=Anthostomella pinea TaxID=933095 RepID=A0AAI8VHG3_9PEZI|nr:Uu.00g124120.m01.CDS01 [Anthostomella pinea]
MTTQADYDRLGGWAVMLNPDAGIDRHKCTRTIPMEVLSLGFSRTATLSMQEAFSFLGYPDPYHYSSIFANIKDPDMEFDQLLGHCGAVTDAPAVCFRRELTEAYPEAKVVLVERDEDRWYKSFEGVLEGVLDPFLVCVLRFTDPFWLGRIVNVGMLWIEGFTGSTDLQQARANARAAYRKLCRDTSYGAGGAVAGV